MGRSWVPQLGKGPFSGFQASFTCTKAALAGNINHLEGLFNPQKLPATSGIFIPFTRKIRNPEVQFLIRYFLDVTPSHWPPG